MHDHVVQASGVQLTAQRIRPPGRDWDGASMDRPARIDAQGLHGERAPPGAIV